MKKKDQPLTAVPDPAVRAVLSRLHAEADRETPKLVWRFASQGPRLLFGRKLPWDRLASRVDDAFIAVDRTQGAFCYLLARALGARQIVEFGTSYAISTIYLACAVRDNGGGLVVGAERVPRQGEEGLGSLARGWPGRLRGNPRGGRIGDPAGSRGTDRLHVERRVPAVRPAHPQAGGSPDCDPEPWW